MVFLLRLCVLFRSAHGLQRLTKSSHPFARLVGRASPIGQAEYVSPLASTPGVVQRVALDPGRLLLKGDTLLRVWLHPAHLEEGVLAALGVELGGGAVGDLPLVVSRSDGGRWGEVAAFWRGLDCRR